MTKEKVKTKLSFAMCIPHLLHFQLSAKVVLKAAAWQLPTE